jgi:hypothetical protein
MDRKINHKGEKTEPGLSILAVLPCFLPICIHFPFPIFFFLLLNRIGRERKMAERKMTETN